MCLLVGEVPHLILVLNKFFKTSRLKPETLHDRKPDPGSNKLPGAPEPPMTPGQRLKPICYNPFVSQQTEETLLSLFICLKGPRGGGEGSGI